MAKRRGNGDGSVHQRKSDGLWVATVSLGIVNGKPKRRSQYAQTKKEAREKLAAMQRAIAAGQQIGSDQERLAPYLDRWLTNVVMRRVRPTTAELYTHIINVHLKPTFGHIQLGKLTPDHVRTFLNGLADEDRARTSIKNIRNVFRLAINHAVREQVLMRNVVTLVDIPQAGKKPFVMVDPAMAGRILDAIEGTNLQAIITTALMLGLRRGELLGMRWQDIDWERDMLTVNQSAIFVRGQAILTTPKTTASQRDVPIPPYLVTLLHTHRAEQLQERLRIGTAWVDLDLVFPGGTGIVMEPSTFDRRYKRMLVGAGLPSGVTIHGLRHAFASLMASVGAEPRASMETLGHTELRTTLGVYTHAFEDQKRAAVNAVSEALLRRRTA